MFYNSDIVQLLEQTANGVESLSLIGNPSVLFSFESA